MRPRPFSARISRGEGSPRPSRHVLGLAQDGHPRARHEPRPRLHPDDARRRDRGDEHREQRASPPRLALPRRARRLGRRLAPERRARRRIAGRAPRHLRGRAGPLHADAPQRGAPAAARAPREDLGRGRPDPLRADPARRRVLARARPRLPAARAPHDRVAARLQRLSDRALPERAPPARRRGEDRLSEAFDDAAPALGPARRRAGSAAFAPARARARGAQSARGGLRRRPARRPLASDRAAGALHRQGADVGGGARRDRLARRDEATARRRGVRRTVREGRVGSGGSRSPAPRPRPARRPGARSAPARARQRAGAPARAPRRPRARRGSGGSRHTAPDPTRRGPLLGARRVGGRAARGDRLMRVLAEPSPLPFRREKTLAVGLLAFLAPIPFAFTNALEVGALVLYLAAAGFLLAYTAKGRVLTLSNAALNTVGVLYAGLLWVDLRYGSRTLLKTALHLLLFTTIVKLASIKKERDFSVALALAGFLFLASVATSFHYSIGAFVLVYLLVGWPVLVRWSLWRDLAGAPEEWRRDRDVRRLPGLAPTFASVAAAILLATPLFFVLPRLPTPFVRGLEQGRGITTGLSG